VALALGFEALPHKVLITCASAIARELTAFSQIPTLHLGFQIIERPSLQIVCGPGATLIINISLAAILAADPRRARRCLWFADRRIIVGAGGCHSCCCE